MVEEEKITAVEDSKFCEVCRRSSRLRCSRCQHVWYCSPACQKTGWKNGHRKACRPAQGALSSEMDHKAKQAMLELQTIMTGEVTMDLLKQEYHKAKDAVELLKSKKIDMPPSNSTRQEAGEKTKKVSTKVPVYELDPYEAKSKDIQLSKVYETEQSESSQHKNGLKSDQTENGHYEKGKDIPSRMPINDGLPEREETLFWDAWVENLSHISCYHIMMKPKSCHQEELGSLEAIANHLEVSVIFLNNKQYSIVSLRPSYDEDTSGSNNHSHGPILSARLPGKVSSKPSSFQIRKDKDGQALSFKWPYEASLDQQQLLNDPSLSMMNLKESEANHLRCKFCHMRLFREGVAVDRVVRMPSANWDDIADYLICYSGQATIDFTTASTNQAQRGAILVDRNVVVLHEDDVGQSVCVLAVECYGEEDTPQQYLDNEQASWATQTRQISEDEAKKSTTSLFSRSAAEMVDADAPALLRGPRLWRETVGGGAVCCSSCCSILGFASLQSSGTFRFLKHRLVKRTLREKEFFEPLNTCASFVAQEMLRYAETKAIFTFFIERKKDITSQPDKSYHKRVLLLRLLSWNSQFATCDDIIVTRTGEEDNRGITHIQDVTFRPCAKIIYEETWLGDEEGPSAPSGDDLSSWVWGGVDLCCQPLPNLYVEKAPSITAPNSSVSSARLVLESNEWDDLRGSLIQNGSFYPDEIVQATVATRLGKRDLPRNDKGGHIGLSLVPIA